MIIENTRMSGAGNIFSVIDNRASKLSFKVLSPLAKILCSKNEYNKFKSEGLLVLESNENSGLDFQANFFNPDGSFGMMCGNGGRCIINYAEAKNEIQLQDNIVSFSMAGNIYQGKKIGANIQLFLPPPENIKNEINIPLKDKVIDASYINVGSDHVVIAIEKLSYNDINKIPIAEIAPEIRNHEQFAPKGTNVNFYAINKDKTVQLRTYERGVEAETGACGTGAVSTALTVILNDNMNFPVTIIPTSGIALIVNIIGSLPEIKNIILEGPAEVIEAIDVNIPDSLLTLSDTVENEFNS